MQNFEFPPPEQREGIDTTSIEFFLGVVGGFIAGAAILCLISIAMWALD